MAQSSAPKPVPRARTYNRKPTIGSEHTNDTAMTIVKST